MHVQLFEYNYELFFYNEKKKNTSNLSTVHEIPKAPNTNRKVNSYQQR